jgi:general secretion pathway protein E
VRQLERAAVAAGMIDRWDRAITAVEAGLTSPAEVRRVLGVGALPDRRKPLNSRPDPP